MLYLLMTIYLAGWIAATIGVFFAGSRICEPGLPIGYRFTLSVAAGFLWPLLLIGAIEFTSLAMYSSAEHLAVVKGPDFPLLEMDAEQTYGDVVPLR